MTHSSITPRTPRDRRNTFSARVGITLLTLLASSAFLQGASYNEDPGFRQMALPASSDRDLIPSAFGLYRSEVVVSGSVNKIQMPDALAGRSADFDTARIAVAPSDRFTLRYTERATRVRGNTRNWFLSSREPELLIKLHESADRDRAYAFQFSQNTVTPGPIKKNDTDLIELRFLSKPSTTRYGFIGSIAINQKRTDHWTIGSAKTKLGSLTRSTTYAGYGYDQLVRQRLDLGLNLMAISTEGERRNLHGTGKLVWRFGGGFNLSAHVGAFLNGYTTALTEYSDPGSALIGFDKSRLPSTFARFADDAFGYYGVAAHYGVRFW